MNVDDYLRSPSGRNAIEAGAKALVRFETDVDRPPVFEESQAQACLAAALPVLLEGMVAALAFYGDEDAYLAPAFDGRQHDGDEYLAAIDHDSGEMARAALARLKEQDA